jgi:hypothetical protein
MDRITMRMTTRALFSQATPISPAPAEETMLFSMAVTSSKSDHQVS